MTIIYLVDWYEYWYAQVLYVCAEGETERGISESGLCTSTRLLVCCQNSRRNGMDKARS